MELLKPDIKSLLAGGRLVKQLRSEINSAALSTKVENNVKALLA